MKKSFLPAALVSALLLMLGASMLLQAGGPLGATGTTARRYPAGLIPISYRTDLGGLGAFTNATATSITIYAFDQWDNVQSAALSFDNDGSLARNVTSATDAYISGSSQYSDGINPMVFDSSGAITDARLGAGAKSHVLGFAGSAWNGSGYVEGYAIINGYLSGSGSATDQDKYKSTITHEIGHFVGLHHSQIGMHGDYPTMYPQIIKNSAQMTLDPDDTAAIALLYPTTAFTSSVGSISGTVKTPAGTNLSGVNVIAEDSVTGAAYSTLVDYFSGDDVNSFYSKPSAAGTYRISGLPPGRYFVRIEPVNSNFSGGSSLGSYRTPVNSSVAREWYNGTNESGDMLLDNTNQKTGVVVTAGSSVTGINLVSNESATLGSISYHNGVAAVLFPLPGGSGNSFTRYATKFTAPSDGSLVGVKLRFENNSSLPLNGTLTVTVHDNTSGSLNGIPGTSLGSVTIPFSDLASDQLNEIWLRGLGTDMNFLSGEHFHVSFTTNGVGSVSLLMDNGNPTENRSSYYTSAQGWRNFPQGFISGTPGYNLMVSAVYSTTVAGNPQPDVALSPTSLNFGRVRPGANAERTLTLTNTGTATLNVANTPITGPDSLDYVVTSGGGAFSLGAGNSRNIVVRFSPSSGGGAQEQGTKSATLSIISNAATSPDQTPLLGYGVMPSANRLTPTIEFGARRTGGTYSLSTAIIRNTGNDTLHISGTSLGGADASAFRIVSATGALILPPDSIYTVQVQFLPTARRIYSATLTVTHDDAVGTTTLSLGGTGTAPVVAVVDTLSFGDVRVGSPALASVTIRNVGDASLTTSGLTFTGADAGVFQVVSPSSLPQTIAAGDSLVVQVRFSPLARRLYVADLVVTGNADPGSTTIRVSGRGIASVLVTSFSHDAGDVRVDSSVATSLVISNGGDAPLVISSLDITGPQEDEFAFGPASLPLTIAPGATYTLPITFTPASRGLRTATLVVDGNDPATPRSSIQLAGTGLQGELLARVAGIDFGDLLVGENAERTAVIRNSGSASVMVSAVDIAGTGFAIISAPPPGTVVQPGDTMLVTVQFSPLIQGAHSGSVTIRSNDLPSPLVITLAGRGVLPGLAVSRTLIAFGDVPTGESRLDSIAVRNTGTSSLNGVTLTLTGSDADAFEVVRPSGTISIAPGDSVMVVVRLKDQSSSGPLGATLRVQAAGGLESLIGVTANIVRSGISVVREIEFGTRSAGSNSDTSIVVRNSGTAPLVIDSAAVTGAKDGVAGSYFTLSVPTPQTILPGDSLLLAVRFSPDDAGEYTGTLSFATNVPGTPEIEVMLHGRVEQTVGVEERTVTTGGISLTLLPVAPNPAHDRVAIRMRVAGDGTTRALLRLIDLRGNVVGNLYDGVVAGSGTARELRLQHSLGSIPAGEYHLVLTAGGRITSTRVVVVR